MFLNWKKLGNNARDKKDETPMVWRVLVILVLAGFALSSCKEADEVPPIITLKGADTLFHVLNSVYSDPGFQAIDETDGDITSNVFVDNPVDIDRMGEYTITYGVVDETGNEATPAKRVVYVYNQALDYYGDYQVDDQEVYPGQEQCFYPSYVWVDSTVNMRLVFLDFACSSKRQVFADVSDTVIVIPFQMIQDSVINMSLQGAGSINDSLISLEYTRTEPNATRYWKVNFYRVQ